MGTTLKDLMEQVDAQRQSAAQQEEQQQRAKRESFRGEIELWLEALARLTVDQLVFRHGRALADLANVEL